MPAGPIGNTWTSGSWTDTCWELGSWADVGVIAAEPISILEFFGATYDPRLTVLGRYAPAIVASQGSYLPVTTVTGSID